MTRLAHTLVLAGVLLAARQAPVAAQSVQRFSLQGSGSLIVATDAKPTFDPQTRPALEAQVRYTISRFSIGVGVVIQSPQNNLHELRASGFIEPRLVLAAGAGKAFYVAGRLGVGKFICVEGCTGVGSNVTYGGGGGFLFRLSSRLSADLGVQYLRVIKWSSSGYAMARAGLGFGL